MCIKVSEPVRVSCVYLVVDDHVYGAVCSVRRKVAQMEGFVDDALAGKRSVTVEQDGHHLNMHAHTQIRAHTQTVLKRRSFSWRVLGVKNITNYTINMDTWGRF